MPPRPLRRAKAAHAAEQRLNTLIARPIELSASIQTANVTMDVDIDRQTTHIGGEPEPSPYIPNSAARR